MALLKEIKLENGISLRYHRIVSINNIVNNQIMMEIASYIDEGQRTREKGGAEDVFIHTEFINMPSEEQTDIASLYRAIQTAHTLGGTKNLFINAVKI